MEELVLGPQALRGDGVTGSKLPRALASPKIDLFGLTQWLGWLIIPLPKCWIPICAPVRVPAATLLVQLSASGLGCGCLNQV